MVPLRIISKNLWAKVDWSSSQATITKGDVRIILKPDSKEAIKNGQIELLDAITYAQNDRVMVPLRFIAETFGCEVNYKDRIVVITTEPLMINSKKAKALNYEYHMTMGGSISEIRVNSFPEEDLKDYPKRLLHDVTLDKWYLLKEDDVQLIMQLIDLARENGILKVINNSIV